MIIPEAVKKAASHILGIGGAHIEHLGKIQDGRDAYTCSFKEEVAIGYPEIYLYDGHLVYTASGSEAFNIFDELGIE